MKKTTKDKAIKEMEKKPVEINVRVGNGLEIALFSMVLNNCFMEFTQDPNWLKWVNSKNEFEVTQAATAFCVPLLQTYTKAFELNKELLLQGSEETNNGKSN